MKENYKNKSVTYGPDQRDYLEGSEKKPKAYSIEDSIELTNHVVDPIVVNNIAYQEFDYTYNGGEDIPVVDEDENFHNVK